MNNIKVKLPIRTLRAIALAKRVLKKHTEAGDNSPLNFLNTKKFLNLLDEISLKHQASKQLLRESKLATEHRNQLLGTVREADTLYYFLASSRDILLGIYKGDERMLGDWGFDVIRSSGKSPDISSDV